MHSGKRNPLQLPDVEQYTRHSAQLISDKSNQTLFSCSSNYSATIDFEAHVNTKKDYSKIHVCKTMSVVELITLHTICEVERTQLLTILAMSVKNPPLAGFFLNSKP